jgi:hypothetical protein
MTEIVGQCGLCLQPRVLRGSHLLPAALYNFVRDQSGGTDRNPVHVTARKTFTSSKQIKAPFLCDDCEEKFSGNGESYVLKQCNRQDGTFRLGETLQAPSRPVWEQGKYKLYDVAALLGNNTEQYLYFGASVFWRAAARSWRGVNRINLGDYQEEFRLYLLGDAKFPVYGRLIVHVSIEDDFTDVILPPSTGRSKLGRLHRFYIPGIVFTLCLGREVLRNEYNAIALNSSKGKFMLLCPWKEDPLFRMVRAFVKQSPAAGSLLARKAGADS